MKLLTDRDIWEGIKTVFKSKDKANAVSSPQRIAPAPTKRTIQQPVKKTSLLTPATQTSSTTTNAVKYPIRPFPDFTFSPDSPAWKNKADDIPDLTPTPKPEMKKFIAPNQQGIKQAEDVYPMQQTNAFAPLSLFDGNDSLLFYYLMNSEKKRKRYKRKYKYNYRERYVSPYRGYWNYPRRQYRRNPWRYSYRPNRYYYRKRRY